MSNLRNRVRKLEQSRTTGETLIYTHEAPDGKGGLILLSNRRNMGAAPVEVGRVPVHELARHRREVVRIQRSYGASVTP